MDIRGSHNVNKILMTYQFLSLVSLQADRKKKKKKKECQKHSILWFQQNLEWNMTVSILAQDGAQEHKCLPLLPEAC